MSPEQAIYQRLAATSGVTDLVGGTTAPRIYPNEADEDAPRPLVVYGVVSTVTTRDVAGNVQILDHSVLVICESVQFDQGRALAAAVLAALDGQQFSGIERCYAGDYSTAETDVDKGGYEFVQQFRVIQFP